MSSSSSSSSSKKTLEDFFAGDCRIEDAATTRFGMTGVCTKALPSRGTADSWKETFLADGAADGMGGNEATAFVGVVALEDDASVENEGNDDTTWGALMTFCLVACTRAAISVALSRTRGGTGEHAATTALAFGGIISARPMSMWFGRTYLVVFVYFFFFKKKKKNSLIVFTQMHSYLTLSSSLRAVMSRQA